MAKRSQRIFESGGVRVLRREAIAGNEHLGVKPKAQSHRPSPVGRGRAHEETATVQVEEDALRGFDGLDGLDAELTRAVVLEHELRKLAEEPLP